ncbi:MAG: tRNA 2-thiouridine(34) synthase MnmA [Spirochaetota bacterium]
MGVELLSDVATSDIQTSIAKLYDYLGNMYALDSRRKIVVLLSGGVDSSVALAALKHYGCRNLSAYYLKIWFEDEARFLGACPWEEDLEYAASVCEQLDIPLHVVSMQQQYYDYVVAYTLDELRSGRTPSPDLLCNELVKFGAFLRQWPHDPPLIVSGHYALLQPFSLPGESPASGRQELLLLQAPDLVKDQSYFLSRLQPSQLQKLLFPLGVLHKAEVRRLAEHWGLATARRRDSQGICFLGKVRFRDFAEHYLGRKPGTIIDADSGEKLGEHQGLWFHTIGQRQGLGLGGGPWYVCAKDMEANCLYVRHAKVQERPDFQMPSRFWVEAPNWLQSRAVRELLSGGPLQLKLRHGPHKIECALRREPTAWQVSMKQGDRGVAAGQFAVFYWGNICLGSAAIRGISSSVLP